MSEMEHDERAVRLATEIHEATKGCHNMTAEYSGSPDGMIAKIAQIIVPNMIPVLEWITFADSAPKTLPRLNEPVWLRPKDIGHLLIAWIDSADERIWVTAEGPYQVEVGDVWAYALPPLPGPEPVEHISERFFRVIAEKMEEDCVSYASTLLCLKEEQPEMMAEFVDWIGE